MTSLHKIDKYILLDILKNKFVVLYMILLAVLSWTMLSLESDSTKGVLSLLNLVLLTTPLISIIFTTTYLYNSAEFIELLLSQPVGRRKIWRGLYMGLFFSLSIAFLAGSGIPAIMLLPFNLAMTLIVMGVLITAVFVSIGFLATILTRDKAKGVGFSILAWVYCSLLYDGILLFLMFQFSDYPIEKALVGLVAANPIDLARVYTMLQLDASALMGYTGAIFKTFFGTGVGILVGLGMLGAWILIPYLISQRRFATKDL